MKVCKEHGRLAEWEVELHGENCCELQDELAVTKITETNPMLREMNRGLAVQYINADLVGRAHLDVRTSYIFYDEDMMFSNLMLSIMVNEDVLPMLAEKTKIRYWSKGIV